MATEGMNRGSSFDTRGADAMHGYTRRGRPCAGLTHVCLGPDRRRFAPDNAHKTIQQAFSRPIDRDQGWIGDDHVGFPNPHPRQGGYRRTTMLQRWAGSERPCTQPMRDG